MSLEKILERIRQDAQGEIDKIKSNVSATVDDITKKAQADAETLKTKLLEEAKNEAEQHKQRIVSMEKLELRNALLDEKQKAIDIAFQKALDGLIKMDINRYRKMLVDMIVSNVATGDEEIILSKKDKTRLGDGFIKEINRQLAKNDKKGNLIMSKDSYDMIGGFVLRRGDIELNSSFESLFKSSRDDLESEVSEKLFSEQ
jgi:V/A-type H+-transporting ATPase subunit E